MNSHTTLPLAQKARLRWAVTVALGVALTAVLGAGAQAGETGRKKQTKSVYLVKYRVGDEVRYGKNPAGNVVKITVGEYMSNNSYVCTPSGFGRKAFCRAI
ncbi:hypothetical protein [Shinella kummerowiae]|uniref:hypothetical protein n=1 Tax=Shinella kummerowiae TaxID=417745 RepID=UPI0021B6DAA0|nr:hypothetical protein [Shinella kummerowiae]MCT7667507.1 hypothetical protein [Shinella kummerowiae]